MVKLTKPEGRVSWFSHDHDWHGLVELRAHRLILLKAGARLLLYLLHAGYSSSFSIDINELRAKTRSIKLVYSKEQIMTLNILLSRPLSTQYGRYSHMESKPIKLLLVHAASDHNHTASTQPSS